MIKKLTDDPAYGRVVNMDFRTLYTTVIWDF